MKRPTLVAACVGVLICMGAAGALARPTSPPPVLGAGTVPGGFSLVGLEGGPKTPKLSASKTPPPLKVLTIDCGPPEVVGHQMPIDRACGNAHLLCDVE